MSVGRLLYGLPADFLKVSESIDSIILTVFDRGKSRSRRKVKIFFISIVLLCYTIIILKVASESLRNKCWLLFL